MIGSRMSTVSKPPASTARVAVVTVSYGSEDVLGPFLASLPSASRQPLHVVVADNKPAATTNAVESMTTSAGGTYLSLPSNRGYGYAINTAVRESQRSAPAFSHPTARSIPRLARYRRFVPASATRSLQISGRKTRGHVTIAGNPKSSPYGGMRAGCLVPS